MSTSVHILPGQRILQQLAAPPRNREICNIEPTSDGFTVVSDWVGDSGPGTFAIGGTATDTIPFQHITTEADNDVAIPSVRLSGKLFPLHVMRGPAYPGSQFGVKVIPIDWITTPPIKADAAAIVTRGVDYRYQDGVVPERIDWQEAQFRRGAFRATLMLKLGTDYEIWIRLQHPDGSDVWRIQDPIVITEPGGGGQGAD